MNNNMENKELENEEIETIETEAKSFIKSKKGICSIVAVLVIGASIFAYGMLESDTSSDDTKMVMSETEVETEVETEEVDEEVTEEVTEEVAVETEVATTTATTNATTSTAKPSTSTSTSTATTTPSTSNSTSSNTHTCNWKTTTEQVLVKAAYDVTESKTVDVYRSCKVSSDGRNYTLEWEAYCASNGSISFSSWNIGFGGSYTTKSVVVGQETYYNTTTVPAEYKTVSTTTCTVCGAVK